MQERVESLITAVIDEAFLSETKVTTIKKGDSVKVTRGALTGEEGEVTYVSPCKTLADVKFVSGKVGRVSMFHLTKASKAEKKK